MTSGTDWRERRLGDLFKIKHGYAFEGRYFSTSGPFVLLTPGNFHEEGGFKQKSGKEKFYDGPVPGEYVLNRGDLLLAMTEQAEGLLGSSAIIPESGRYLHNQRLGLVTDLDEEQIDKQFLYYLFNTGRVRDQIRATATGTKVRHTAPVRIHDVKVCIPSVVEQRKLASLLSAYDDLIENNSRRIAILEEMARSLYREWFVDFRFPGHEPMAIMDSKLGQIPQGWGTGSLQDALILQRGFDLPIQNRRAGSIVVYAATGPVGTHDEVKVQGPGVVTGRSGSLGKVMYVQEDFWPLNTTLWVKEFRRSTPLWSFYLLSSLTLQEYNSGAAVPTLNRNDIHGLPVILPPFDLVEAFDRFASVVHTQIRILQQGTVVLKVTRDLLLPKLISGELDVRAAIISEMEPLESVAVR